MSRKKSRSISTSMVLCFTALILILTLLTVGVSYNYTREQLQRGATDYTQQLIDQINAELDMYVEYIKNVSDFVVSNPTVISYLSASSSHIRATQYDRVVQVLQNAANIRKEIAVIALLPADGEAVFGDRSATLNAFSDYQNAAWYTQALATPDEVCVSSSRVENVVEGKYRWVVSFSKAIAGGEQGVLLVDLNYEVIDAICANIQLGNRGYIFLLDAGGEILWHPQQNLINANLKTEDMAFGADGVHLRTTDAGLKLYITSSSASTGWTAVGVAYPSELLENSGRMFALYATVGGLAALVAVLLSVFISRAITNPLRRLTATMQQVEQGDFSVRCDIHTKNEVGQLGENFNHMINNTQTLMAEQLRNEEHKRLNEWRVLQAQIKPHFIYNTLDSIIWMSHAGKNEQVVEMTSALASLLRNAIGSGKEIITLEEELRHVESYLVIQTMRYREKLRYELDVDPQTLGCMIPRLILQPLVENAIYHGVKVKEDGGKLRIGAMLDEDRLLITVEDDGPGMTEQQLAHIHEQKESDESSSKIGVYNVTERLRIYFGADFGLKFFSEPEKGTTAMLILPIHFTQKEPADETEL